MVTKESLELLEKQLQNLVPTAQPLPVLVLKSNDENCITANGDEEQGEVFSAIFKEKPDVKAIMLINTEYTMLASKKLTVLKASLDDMAQIVGITAKIANDFTENTILNCLKKRNACLVKGKGMLVTGRSSKEALTTAVLLEKACRTEILGERIGGVKKVPLIAAIIMHYVYQKKYSVIDLTEQEKEEGYV